MTISDRLVLLNAGVVEQVGSPPELYHAPRSPFVAGFLGGGNVIDGDAQQRADGTLVLAADDLTFQLPDGTAERGTVTVVLRNDRVRIGAPEQGGRTGTVEQAAFLGSAWRYRVRLDGGRVVHAAGTPAAGHVATEGARVAVSWDTDDVTVVGAR